MRNLHRALPGYAPTPLTKVPRLAEELGIGALSVKDESFRFGVKAFKPLGASYAVYCLMKRKWETTFDSTFDPIRFTNPNEIKKLGEFTFCAASDGNHGRAVAWTARLTGQKAVIYMPKDTVKSRIENIESEGGRVVVTDGTYDDCVRQIAKDAKKNGWIEIGDTAYEGYTEIPSWVMLGYTTLFDEIWGNDPTGPSCTYDFVFLQAGVGAFASAGISHMVKRFGKDRPSVIIVEPREAAGYLDSIVYGSGDILPARGKMETIMAGLNCGIPSLKAWPIVRDTADLFISIPDRFTIEAMKALAGEGIISGESGASGLAGLIALMNDPDLKEGREGIGLGRDSRILVISTEGDTDPVNYKKIVGNIG